MSKRKMNMYIYIYIYVCVCDSIWLTYSIHKMIINYSKHKLEQYVHLGNIFQTYFFGIRRESRWQQFLNLESSGGKKYLETRADHTTVEKMLFLASVTSHWSRTLCSWWPALARVPGWEKLSILCCLGKALTVAGVMISSRGPFLIDKGMSHTFYSYFIHVLWHLFSIPQRSPGLWAKIPAFVGEQIHHVEIFILAG